MGGNLFGLNAIKYFGANGLYSTQRINNNPYMNFGLASLDRDTFEYQTNSLGRHTTEANLTKMIKGNPRIREILRENGMQGELNMENLRALLAGHAKDTQKIAKGITEHLPVALKYGVNEKSLSDACYLHDLGKVLIPDAILNKPARLTPDEEKIMHTHSELSYELLKHSDIDTRTLDLIKYHHQNPLKSGYPQAKPDFNADINLQVLSAADKFSALTEKRPYKEPLSNEQALGIMYKDVKEGKMHPFIFKALVAHVHAQAPADKTAKSA